MHRTDERQKKTKVAYLFILVSTSKEKEMDLKERECKSVECLVGLGTETSAGCCEHGNELLLSQI